MNDNTAGKDVRTSFEFWCLMMWACSLVALNYGVFRRAEFNGTATSVMFYGVGASSTTVTIVCKW